MSALSLAVQTLYAELLQQLRLARHDTAPGSISRREISGSTHLYSTERHGSVRRQRYLGPAGEKADQDARDVLRAAENARERRKLVAMLRSAGVASPPAPVSRVLDALARAKMFEPHRLVLVGTLAYGTYPLLLGANLTSSALVTNDIDLSVMPLVVTAAPEGLSIPAILTQGDPSLEPDRVSTPPSRFRSPSGLVVEFLTIARRKDAAFQPMHTLGISAEALPYMDFLIDENVEAAIAWQDGVLVRVPAPARFAVHKMIVAQLRPAGDPKRNKDLLQARDLATQLEANDPDTWDDMVKEARARGRSWSTKVDAGLRLIGR
jgi:hypothetical protein